MVKILSLLKNVSDVITAFFTIRTSQAGDVRITFAIEAAWCIRVIDARLGVAGVVGTTGIWIMKTHKACLF